MNLVLFTGNDCSVCDEVQKAFADRFKEELDNGEASIVNLDEEEDAQQFWFENDLPLAPCLVVVSDSKKLVSILDAQELLKHEEASPAAESGG